MTREIAPELHRPVAAERIGPQGLESTVEAGPAECAALARRLQIPAVRALRCRFRLTPAPAASFEATGHLQARVVQTCVMTLEEFEAEVEERFGLRFVPEGAESDDPDPEAEDEVAYRNGVIDLGDAAAEQLALALDPYPRKPGSSLPEAQDAEAGHPFARLAALKRAH
jgi:uncharacterized metal-binding protein YceD (DUF177 family)